MHRLAPSKLQEVQQQVTVMLAKKLIEPSTSPYEAPILFEELRTGQIRMVVDYRALNKITVKHCYPLPCMDDIFDKLFGAQYFLCLLLLLAVIKLFCRTMISLNLHSDLHLVTTSLGFSCLALPVHQLPSRQS